MKQFTTSLPWARLTPKPGIRPVLIPALVLSLLLGLLLSLSTVAWGLSGKALDERVREISDGLRCPTCQAISVNDSEAAFSRQIREKVRRMLQEGQNEQQIKAYFVSRYGEWILRAPKKEGLGLVLWILPILLILVIGAWIVFNIRRSGSGAGNQSTKTQPALRKADQERIERDLRRFEEED